MVRYFARRYAGRGEPMDDLIQAGSLGLVKAVDRFEPERGLEFSTYAAPTILGEIRRHFRDRTWAVHVHRGLQELTAEITRYAAELTQELNRAPSVAELVAYAKANPGKLTFGSGSSSSRVCGELLKLRAGIDITHVAYRSIPPALMDVVGGQISLAFADPQSGLPQVQAGKVRGLAVSGTSRIALAPDLPTMEEAGVKDYDIVAYFAAFAPARTPQPVLDRLYAAFSSALRDPATSAKLASVGIEPSASTPSELQGQVAAEIQKWSVIVKAAGMEPQ